MYIVRALVVSSQEKIQITSSFSAFLPLLHQFSRIPRLYYSILPYYSRDFLQFFFAGLFLILDRGSERDSFYFFVTAFLIFLLVIVASVFN